MSSLVRQNIPRFGEIYFPRQGIQQVESLAHEVGEYFREGVTLSPGDVVFDVGANIGTFAIEAAGVSKGLRFVCVEPIPPLFEALKRNFESHSLLRDCQRTLLNMGLTRPGDPDEADFYYFKRLPCDSTRHIDEKRGEFEQFFAAKGDTVRSFCGKHLGPVGRVVGGVVGGVVAAVPRGPVGRWITDRATGITRFSCPLTTIARVLEQERIDSIGLLKVDVEGAEMEVLAGVGDENWPRVRQLALEGHDKDGRLEEARALCQRVGFDKIHVMHPQVSIDRGLANFVLIARRTQVH